MGKVKNFFKKIMPSKRKLIQLYAALLFNANMKGFITGKIYTGKTKSVCLPGMNCYSCPGAVGACPLGSLQNALSESKTKAPTYVLGIILLYCITLGRTICGYLCPAGFLQELLYKIKTPKLKKSKVTRVLSYFKYVLLFVLVFTIPLIYGLQKHNVPLPAYCKYVCPVGTFEGAGFLLIPKSNSDLFGMLGGLFTWKFCLLIIFIVASVFIFRFFCRFFCPLGALYGLFNKLSIIGIKVDKNKCNHCNACINHCKMDVKVVGDHECINCGECRSVCNAHAISWKTIGKLIEEEKLEKNDVVEEISSDVVEDIALEKPKKKINKRMLYGGITTTILLGFLIFAFVYYNVDRGKKIYAVNEVCEDFTTKLYNDETYNIHDSSNAKLIYFYESFDETIVNQLKSYQAESLDIVLISSYETKDESQSSYETSFKDTNMIFGYDSVNATALNTFSESMSYPYYVLLDKDNKVVLKQETLSEKVYQDIIYPTISGLEFGNQVGQLCISQDIHLIGSDEVFNVIDQKGKITIINFWGTWCTPCVAELPSFDEIQKEYKEEVTVIAIHDAQNYDSTVIKYIESHWPDFEILFGYDAATSNGLSEYYVSLGGSQTYPMTLIVDQSGVIQVVRQGSITKEELKTFVESLL
ncbi:MAG: 4Fe-4S binding protein [Anaeroplasmataceae bacterium]|nr:4Fe-4S binding protein [Anaeroplasmataceae bacterium]